MKIEETAQQLKKIIDAEGTEYIVRYPYQVYEKLSKNTNVEHKLLSAVLCFLVSDVAHQDIQKTDMESLSCSIRKECGFNKTLSDALASIFTSLYCNSNLKEWEKKEEEGLRLFLREKFSFSWEGAAVWEVDTGGVNCYYNAEIELKPEETICKDGGLQEILKNNPFATKETIGAYFSEKLKKYLDGTFDDYCTCEEYYEPCCEDFELESYTSDWCKENGFILVSCDGTGGESDFCPKFRHYW